MIIAAQARAHIGAIVQHIAPGLPLKSALPRVANFLKLNTRRVRALWNREARAVLAEEMAALQSARARISERIITTELHEHANQIELEAARLAAVDSDAHRGEIHRLRSLARRVRGLFDREEA